MVFHTIRLQNYPSKLIYIYIDIWKNMKIKQYFIRIYYNEYIFVITFKK